MSDDNLRVYAALRDEIEDLKLKMHEARQFYLQDLGSVKSNAALLIVGAFIFGLLVGLSA